jgi:hypothetical protein
MSTEIKSKSDHSHAPWNKSRLVGQKRPLRPKEVWCASRATAISYGSVLHAKLTLGIWGA